MRLLIFGAGVLGTFYAAKLQACGHDVTVLARGRRAVFTNLAGPQRLINVLGRERVVLGFPGAAGGRASDGTVLATVLPALIQKTTVGELDGRPTPRVRLLAAALRVPGFPTAISSSMDAWLKTHVAIVSPIADAFYAAGGNLKILANSRFQVIAMLRSIRKAFEALRAQGLPVTPARLRGVELLPAWLLVAACQWALRTSYAELIVARHATVAREEMAVLAEQLHAPVERSAGMAAQASSAERGRP